jgi:hypothetical protein
VIINQFYFFFENEEIKHYKKIYSKLIDLEKQSQLPHRIMNQTRTLFSKMDSKHWKKETLSKSEFKIYKTHTSQISVNIMPTQ